MAHERDGRRFTRQPNDVGSLSLEIDRLPTLFPGLGEDDPLKRETAKGADGALLVELLALIGPGSAGVLSLATDGSGVSGWAGPYTGPSGAPGPGTRITALALNDGDTAYDAVQDGTSGNNPQRIGLASLVTPGTYIVAVTCRVFSPFVLDSGQFTTKLYNPNGDGFVGPVINLAGLDSTWTPFSSIILVGGTPASIGGPANTVEVGAAGVISGLGQLVLTTYVNVRRV